MTKLKPCPHCGNEKIQIHEKRRGNYRREGDNYQAWCTKCKGRGPLVNDVPQLAEDKWNTRHTPSLSDEAILELVYPAFKVWVYDEQFYINFARAVLARAVGDA